VNFIPKKQAQALHKNGIFGANCEPHSKKTPKITPNIHTTT